MFSEDTLRLNVVEGEYLGARDFQADQWYNIAMRRRGNLGPTTWGIYGGLELTERDQPGGGGGVDLFVSPGLAVDGFGREILVFAPAPVDPAKLIGDPRFVSDMWVKIWIRFETEQTDPPRPGYELCQDPSLMYRTRETYRIEVGDNAQWHDQVQVAGRAVADTDLPIDLSVPFQDLPTDDERAAWWVPLGYAHWNGADGFLKSTGTTDQDQAARIKDRVYGGDVAGHTYALDGAWELISRTTDPADPTNPAHRVVGSIRGKLVVEDLTYAKGAGVELAKDARVMFDDASDDQTKQPFQISRAVHSKGSDLVVQIGKNSGGDSGLAVRGGGSTDLLRVRDSGDVHVEGVLDVISGAKATGDRILLAGAKGDKDAAAIGLDPDGSTLFERAPGGFEWFQGDKPGGDTVMRLISQQLSVKGGVVVGAAGDASLKTRHVVGKQSGNDAVDKLYLNWDNGNDVVVGRLDGLHSNLVVSGDILSGANGNKVTPVDVQIGVGQNPAGLSNLGGGGIANGQFAFSLTSNKLPHVTSASLVIVMTDFSYEDINSNGRWVMNAQNPPAINGSTATWNISWEIECRGRIDEWFYVAVFNG
jgi:hypothetical protein